MNMTTNANQENETVTIYAAISAMLDNDESIEDFKKRNVDIYLHGSGELGYQNKEDLGGDLIHVSTNPKEELVLVNKGLLLALLDTAKRTTDLESICDDTNNTSYPWSDVNNHISGADIFDTESAGCKY